MGTAFYRLLALPLLFQLVLTGCTKTNDNTTYLTTTVTGTGTTTIDSTGPAQNSLNAKTLIQFQSPFIEIPIAPVTANTYTVTARQYPDWDFGLRVRDGVTGQIARPINPATGKSIKTSTWYYDVNGAPLGIYGATVEVSSGTPATFVYVNDLRDELTDTNGVPMKDTGPLLTKHLLIVDDTVDGMNLGEPEVRMVTHLHGGHVDWRFDGHPEAWVTNISAADQIANGVQYGIAADPSRGFPGRPSDNKVQYVYGNDQEAATLWFHDHSYGITRLQAYAGMAAVYLIRDDVDSGDSNTLGLPSGKYSNPVVPSLQSYKYDLPIVLQDKSFNADGSLIFPTFTNLGAYMYTALRDKNGNATQTLRPEMFGTVNMVNGQAWPSFNVEQTGYRFRFVNGADSRVYNMWLQDADTGEVITELTASNAAPTRAWPVVQVAAEQGLLPAAVKVMTGSRDMGLTLANGERADIVIDFSHPVFAGRKLILRNDAPAPFNGLFGPANEDMATLDPATTGKIMRFVVSSTPGASYDARIMAWSQPNGLKPASDMDLAAPNKIRYLDFQEKKDTAYAFVDPLQGRTFYRTQLLINALRFSDPITEIVSNGAVEEWVIINTTPDMHPLHLHLVKFQVIEKGHVKAGVDPNGTTKLSNGDDPGLYRRADGAGGLPGEVCETTVDDDLPSGCYTEFRPNYDPRLGDPSSTPTGTLVPDTPSNALYARSDNETGWKDTVKVPPAQIEYDPNGGQEVVNPGYVRIRAKFDLPAGADSPATYMYHCHILTHEEHEMMRPFTVQ